MTRNVKYVKQNQVQTGRLTRLTVCVSEKEMNLTVLNLDVTDVTKKMVKINITALLVQMIHSNGMKELEITVNLGLRLLLVLLMDVNTVIIWKMTKLTVKNVKMDLSKPTQKLVLLLIINSNVKKEHNLLVKTGTMLLNLVMNVSKMA